MARARAEADASSRGRHDTCHAKSGARLIEKAQHIPAAQTAKNANAGSAARNAAPTRPDFFARAAAMAYAEATATNAYRQGWNASSCSKEHKAANAFDGSHSHGAA